MSIVSAQKSGDYRMPLGPLALILSKHYYGVLTKSLEKLGIDRYYSVVYYLNGHNGCTQQEICNSLAIDKTAMVKVMDYLVKAGFVKRAVNPDDRREHFVTLTPKGKRQAAIVVKAFKLVDAEVLRGTSKSDKEVFYKMTGRFIRTLKELPSNDLFFNYRKTVRVKRPVSGVPREK